MMANFLAALQVHSGAFATAAALIDEVDALVLATGLPPIKRAAAMLAAYRGDRAQLQSFYDAGHPGATQRGEGSVFGLAHWLNALLANAHGNSEVAFAEAVRGCEYEDVVAYGWTLAELVEAAVRSGRPDAAAAALDRLGERTRAAGTAWALGVEARCRALVSGNEQLYRESIERLESSRAAVELARTRLVYGEWLRREHRRADAREPLRAAHADFTRFGAGAWPSARAVSSSRPARPSRASPRTRAMP